MVDRIGIAVLVYGFVGFLIIRGMFRMVTRLVGSCLALINQLVEWTLHRCFGFHAGGYTVDLTWEGPQYDRKTITIQRLKYQGRVMIDVLLRHEVGCDFTVARMRRRIAEVCPDAYIAVA